jgi:hypothetical protein
MTPRKNALTPTLSRREREAGFTITEMLVAIAVLVVVIIGTSKIFGTASQVTGLGQANQDILATAAAIERQLRDDIARLSNEGFFAIHNVAVLNDVRGPGAPLLNPNLPPDAIIRCDQLVFFATGVESIQSYRMTQGSNHKGQSTVSRLLYGHGFQLGDRGLPVDIDDPDNAEVFAHDPDLQPDGPITPWWPADGNTTANITMVRTRFAIVGDAGGPIYARQAPSAAEATINGTQPESRHWLLVRQPVALVDDDISPNNDNSKTVYLSQVTSARSIFIDTMPPFPFGTGVPAGYGLSREVRNGRVDAAATLPNEVRRWVTFSGVNPRPWSGPHPGPAGGNQQNVIRSAVYWPRGERKAPSMHRVDQALTTPVIAEGCSSFIVDWTYEGSDFQHVDGNGVIKGGVGEVLDVLGNVEDPDNVPNNGDELRGVVIASNGEQPWFGLPFPDADGDSVSDDRGVFPYSLIPAAGASPFLAASTILPINAFPNNIESQSPTGPLNNASVQDYWATFGYNQDQPLNEDPSIDPNPGVPGYREPYAPLGYTPWPSAIRITMVLHDPQGKLESGREFQFIIDLPKRK